MSARTKLIFNPIANLGRAWNVASSLRPIAAEYGGADWAGTVYPTHATELARSAALEGYDTVVAMGGDGTVHEVLNGLMQVPAEKRPRLGIVPIGSGNDLAFSTGISLNPEEAMRQALNGTPHPVDLGLAADNLGREEYWDNAIGLGFDTIVTIHSRKVPIFQGFTVYLLAVLRTILFDYQPFNLHVCVDGKEWTREYMLFVMMNGKREGGGFHVTPASLADDGQLDYLGVDRVSRLKMLQILPAVLAGTHGSMNECAIDTFKEMELTSDKPLYVHLDGEIFATPQTGVNRLSIRLLPGALQVMR